MADSMKKYVLMHKNIPVTDMELDEATCSISAVGHVYSEVHVPVGISVKKGVINRATLNEWWKGRAIPASRAGIKSALVELNLSTTQNLLEKCLGLSLSDQSNVSRQYIRWMAEEKMEDYGWKTMSD